MSIGVRADRYKWRSWSGRARLSRYIRTETRRPDILVQRLAYNGDGVAFKMGRRQARSEPDWR
jgi:hypothetical protein